MTKPGRTTSKSIQVAVRLPLDLHTDAKAAADKVGASLASWIVGAMWGRLAPPPPITLAKPLRSTSPPAIALTDAAVQAGVVAYSSYAATHPKVNRAELVRAILEAIGR